MSVKVSLVSLMVLLFFQEGYQWRNRTRPVKINKSTNVIGVRFHKYDAFYGIPYAEPPVGNLRFTNPVRKELPPGTFSADKIPEICPQLNEANKVTGSEDCLYLNIYRPDTRKSNYPVLFYIHGGSYHEGSAHPLLEGPTYFMENGSLILVTIQYRLNNLGFLSTGDEASPGNFGLKDQTVALRWIKDNIKAFGGNPNSITISGHSAGSGSVHFLMMSPLSRDLINAAIPISGSAIARWNRPTRDPLQLARKQAKLVNVTNADSLTTSELIEELRKVSAEGLISTVPQMKIFGVDPLTLFREVVEKESPDAFLTDTPYNMLKRGELAKVPTMFAVVPNEGAFRALNLAYNETQRVEFNSKLDYYISFFVGLDENQRKFVEPIKERYNLTKGIVDKESRLGIQQLMTDRFFYHPAYRTLELHLNASPATLKFYIFAYRGEHSLTDLRPLLQGLDYGVVHVDDYIYLYDPQYFFPQGLNPQDKAASVEYVNYIVQFVADQTTPGDTRCERMNPMCKYDYFLKNPATGNFEREVRNEFDMEMVEFWDQLGDIPPVCGNQRIGNWFKKLFSGC